MPRKRVNSNDFSKEDPIRLKLYREVGLVKSTKPEHRQQAKRKVRRPTHHVSRPLFDAIIRRKAHEILCAENCRAVAETKSGYWAAY